MDTITLDDGSSKAYILSAKDAPGYGSWIQKGKIFLSLNCTNTYYLKFSPSLSNSIAILCKQFLWLVFHFFECLFPVGPSTIIIYFYICSLHW